MPISANQIVQVLPRVVTGTGSDLVFNGVVLNENSVIPTATPISFVSADDVGEYFGTEILKVIVKQPLTVTNTIGKYDIICKVQGGGFTGQAGAIRHGISRALLEVNDEYRPALKSNGFLTRDPRMKERKKYGLKKARKAPQFSKR